MKTRAAISLLQTVLIFVSLTACSTGRVIAPGQAYSAPIGGFRCHIHPNMETRLSEDFGPHGGTVRFATDLNLTRIDVVEFSPALPASSLSGPQLRGLHEKYLNESLMPLIRSGVPDAKLLGLTEADINGRHVLISAVLFPGKSNVTFGDGKQADGIRAQVQYTNGRFMYTVSAMDHVWQESPAEAQLRRFYEAATEAFAACSFPG